MRYLLLILLASQGLTACSPAPQEHRDTLYVFGTLVEVTQWGVNDTEAAKTLKSIETDLNFMHEAYHAWKPGSLGRVNSLLSTTSRFTANTSLLDLIAESKDLSHKSDGLFNPAIGKLIGLWGFHQDEMPLGPPPTLIAISTLLDKHPSMADIRIDGFYMQSRNPAVQLDLGAIAKGYALDKITEGLATEGRSNLIINAGGNLKVLGTHGDRPWRIAIRHPRNNGVLAALDTQSGEAVVTSGDYERFFDYRGKRYHHIIDPRSGYPSTGTMSVTVVDKNGALADAASTALFIAGAKDWQRIARQMGVTQVLLMSSDGTVYVTPALKDRLTFTTPPARLIVSATE